MDFGALPPEINSGRMYAGPGSGPLLVAAAAWDLLAVDLYAATASYQSVISGLTSGPWRGPASASMASAAAAYVVWLSTTAGQAEQTAAQARAAAAAHEAAFAMTVPPPVIVANRALLTTLVATNFLGQNTPAIAATEGHYAEMWAQDAAAMYGYAGSSAAATRLTPFAQPPQVAGHAIASVPHALGGLALSIPAHVQKMINQIESPYLMATGSIGALMSTVSVLRSLMTPLAAAATTLQSAATGALGRGILGSATLRGAVSAALGRATSVGALSVPQSWATATPAVSHAVAALPGELGAASPGASGLGPMLGGSPLANMAARGEGGAASRYGLRRRFVVTGSPAAG